MIDVVFAKTVALTEHDLPNQTGAERTMLAVLLAARAAGSDPVHVLDFGGACGFHQRAASLLPISTRWAVVESPAMAAKAARLEGAALRFFGSTEEAAQWLGRVDLMFSSSALQYMEEPEAVLGRLIALEAPVVVWSRLPMTEQTPETQMQTSWLSHNGPGPMPPGFDDVEIQYAMTPISLPRFLEAHGNYRLVYRTGDLSSAGFVFCRKDLPLAPAMPS